MFVLSDNILILRALALTIPAVTVEVRLNGFPTANTHSPTLKSSLFPSAIGFKFGAFIFKIATSVEGSAPTTVALYFELSFNITSISLALSITWLLVTIYPSEETITPEPEPDPYCLNSRFPEPGP